MTHFWIWSTGVLKEIIRNKENLGLLSASAVVLENNELYRIDLFISDFFLL